jgi:5'-deoxynucleotidase YfbR-like HD superfamily hydrolase
LGVVFWYDLGMNRFDIAKAKIAEIISQSKTEEDPSHSLNASKWLLVLKPDADEVLQLAALAHDIERAMPDRLKQDQFETYEEFKSQHAHRAGEIAATIIKEAGYSDYDAKRIYEVIKDSEFGNDNPEVNLVMDADSISYFDNNIDYFFTRNGLDKTQIKASFMYGRASDRAKKYILEVMHSKPQINIKL